MKSCAARPKIAAGIYWREADSGDPDDVPRMYVCPSARPREVADAIRTRFGEAVARAVGEELLKFRQQSSSHHATEFALLSGSDEPKAMAVAIRLGHRNGAREVGCWLIHGQAYPVNPSAYAGAI